MTPYNMSPVGLDITTLPAVPWEKRRFGVPRRVVYFLLEPPYTRASLAYIGQIAIPRGQVHRLPWPAYRVARLRIAWFPVDNPYWRRWFKQHCVNYFKPPWNKTLGPYGDYDYARERPPVPASPSRPLTPEESPNAHL